MDLYVIERAEELYLLVCIWFVYNAIYNAVVHVIVWKCVDTVGFAPCATDRMADQHRLFAHHCIPL